MNMRKEIKNAFDSVHAPEELVERMKQELYQKDCHEEIEEICEVQEAPRRSIHRYMAYIAAGLALCIGCGFSVWNLRDNENPLNPHTTVPVQTSTTEETTESGTNSAAAEAEMERQMLLAHHEKARQMLTEAQLHLTQETEVMQSAQEQESYWRAQEEEAHQILLACQAEAEFRMMEEMVRKREQTETKTS